VSRILLDEGVPKPLARDLRARGLDATAFPNDWKQLSNGILLGYIAAQGYDVLLTNDKSMQFQQNIGSRPLAVLVLPTTSLPDLRLRLDEILQKLPTLPIGAFTRLVDQ